MLEEWWSQRDLLCPVEELQAVVVNPKDEDCRMPDPCNLVYQGIYLGGERAARDLPFLTSKGISHVLNAAQGPANATFQVSTSADMYAASDIRYLGLELYDTDGFSIHRFFAAAADFIEEALSSGGKVLVHCKYGISRSATLVVAFLMLRRGLRAKESLRLLKEARSCVGPNMGFMKQLAVLDHEIFSNK